VFRVGGISPQPLIDGETLVRFVGQDLRCSDLNGDGVPEIVDGVTGRAIQLANWTIDLDQHPDSTSLPSC